MTARQQKALDLFERGYNCAQAVAAAFADLTPLDEATVLRLSSSFGGGLGRLREVCGAASGMALIAGFLYGYDDPTDKTVKANHYTRVQQMANAFVQGNGALRCADILGRPGKEAPTPTDRDAAFYHDRPCVRCVLSAARILEDYIAAHPID